MNVALKLGQPFRRQLVRTHLQEGGHRGIVYLAREKDREGEREKGSTYPTTGKEVSCEAVPQWYNTPLHLRSESWKSC